MLTLIRIKINKISDTLVCLKAFNNFDFYPHRMIDPIILLYGKGKLPGFFVNPNMALDVVNLKFLLLETIEIIS